MNAGDRVVLSHNAPGYPSLEVGARGSVVAAEIGRASVLFDGQDTWIDVWPGFLRKLSLIERMAELS